MSEKVFMPISQWDIDDRPREKLLKNGISSLSNAELIAILLGTGTRNLSAVDLAKSILQTTGSNLHLLGKATINDLKKVNGIGEAKAITIMAALEIGRRRKESDIEQTKITSSSHIAEIFSPILADLPHEEFWVVYLSRANNIISKVKHSMGGTSSTILDVKIIIKQALENLSSAIILVHNHPSGSLTVSNHDKSVTEKIKQAAKLFDISLYDHVIISDKKYVSFSDEGLL